jgi:hypothetical protein
MAKRIVWAEQARADLHAIEQPIALQILKTLARYAHAGEGDTKQLRDIEPPLIRLGPRITVSFSATEGIIWRSFAYSMAKTPIAETLSPCRKTETVVSVFSSTA